jgi:hypothetical protein
MDFYKQIHDLENSCTVKNTKRGMGGGGERKKVIEEKESQFKSECMLGHHLNREHFLRLVPGNLELLSNIFAVQ